MLPAFLFLLLLHDHWRIHSHHFRHPCWNFTLCSKHFSGENSVLYEKARLDHFSTRVAYPWKIYIRPLNTSSCLSMGELVGATRNIIHQQKITTYYKNYIPNKKSLFKWARGYYDYMFQLLQVMIFISTFCLKSVILAFFQVQKKCCFVVGIVWPNLTSPTSSCAPSWRPAPGW